MDDLLEKAIMNGRQNKDERKKEKNAKEGRMDGRMSGLEKKERKNNWMDEWKDKKPASSKYLWHWAAVGLLHGSLHLEVNTHLKGVLIGK